MAKKNKYLNRLPCKKCIVMPICRTKYEAKIKNVRYKIYSDYNILILNCGLLRTYLNGKGHSTSKSTEKKLLALEQFFKDIK